MEDEQFQYLQQYLVMLSRLEIITRHDAISFYHNEHWMFSGIPYVEFSRALLKTFNSHAYKHLRPGFIVTPRDLE